jgi:hypothetical protein
MAQLKPKRKTKMKYKWNTKRLYTKEGQKMRAETQADGTILFADDSRCIDGRIRTPLYPITNEFLFRDYVMNAYDHNHYTADTESWSYHMLKGK